MRLEPGPNASVPLECGRRQIEKDGRCIAKKCRGFSWMMMAIAPRDEGRQLGTRPTRMRTGREYAHTNRNDERVRILSGIHMTKS